MQPLQLFFVQTQILIKIVGLENLNVASGQVIQKNHIKHLISIKKKLHKQVSLLNHTIVSIRKIKTTTFRAIGLVLCNVLDDVFGDIVDDFIVDPVLRHRLR